MIKISPRKIFLWCLFIICLLALASILANLLLFIRLENVWLAEVRESLIRLLDVDKEANLPTWFSSLLLAVSAMLALYIGTDHLTRQKSFAKHWLGLAVFLFYLSLDETAIIHEMAIKPLQFLTGAKGLLKYAWIVPGGIVVLIFSGIYMRFVINLPSRVKILFILAASIYFGGALFIEALSGYFADLYGEAHLSYIITTTFEEIFEMSGVAILIYGLFIYLESRANPIRVHIESP